MKKTLITILFAIMISATFNEVYAQKLVYLGRAYAHERINQQLTESVTIYLIEYKNKDIHIQAGCGRNALTCVIPFKESQELLRKMKEAISEFPEVRNSRKNTDRHIISIPEKIELTLISRPNGGHIGIDIKLFGIMGGEKTLFLDAPEARHFYWTLYDEKNVYKKL